MTTIYQTVRDVLAETGIDIDEHPDEGWAAVDGLDGDGSWLLVGQADEEERTLTMYSVPALDLSPERFEPMALLLTRLNYGLAVAAFEIDLDDGEIRCRAGIPVPGDADPDVVRELRDEVLGVTAEYLPAIVSVAHGADPAEVVAALDE